MDFERALAQQIPLHEASHFFLKMKEAEVTDPPDETGALEGQFAAPVEQVLSVMRELVENEFKTMVAYHVYANTLRDLSHNSIAEEFEDHAENEVEHADFLLRRMAVLGGPVQLSEIPPPPASANPADIVNTMIRYEQEGIAKWKVLHALLGENPTKYEVENFLTRELHHLDELWQLLPHEVHTPVLEQKAASEKMKIAFKKMADDGAAAVEGSRMSPPSTSPQTMPTSYLAAEQMSQRAQNANEAGYYKGRLETANMQAQALQQQVDQVNQTMAGLQEQVGQSDAEIQATQEEAQLAQEEARNHAMLAANMRLGMEKLRTQLFDIAAQEPTGTTSQGVLPAGAAEAGAVGQGQATQEMALDPGTAPDSALGGEGGKQPQGPAANAAGAEGAPGAAPSAMGNESARNAPAAGKPPSAAYAEPTSQLANKAASVMPAALGAVGFGALGAAAAAHGARKGTGALKEKVQKLESQEGGFGHALNLAQAKARLAFGEVAEKHPVAATLTGGALGAMGGATAGREIASEIPQIKSLLSSLRA